MNKKLNDLEYRARQEAFSTLDEVVADIIKNMDQKSIDYIKSHGDPGEHHFFGGMAIRNSYGLWGNKPLIQWFIDNFGVAHGDDLSGLVLDGVYQDVKGLPRNSEKIAKSYIAHWKKSGCYPVKEWRKENLKK